MEDNRQQRGSVLVIALFMLLALIFYIGIIVVVILTSLKSATSISQAKRSFYAAESGLERGLYYVESARASKTQGIVYTVDNVINNLAVSAGDSDEFLNEAEYGVSADVDNQNILLDLSGESAVQVDFFDEDASGNLIPLSGIATIVVGWEPDSSCSVPTDSNIEISVAASQPNYWQDLDDSSFQNKYVITCPSGGGYTCEYNGLGVTDTQLYKLRIRPLECGIDEMYIAAYDSASTELETHNTVTITSTGRLGNTQQGVTATVHWRSPLVEYLDYVLFSDEAIKK